MIKSINYVALDRENGIYCETDFPVKTLSWTDKQLGLNDSADSWYYQFKKAEHPADIRELVVLINLLESNIDYANIADHIVKCIFYKIQRLMSNELTFEYIKYDIIKED